MTAGCMIFCEENDLVIEATIFQHNKIHKGKRKSPDGRTVGH